MMYTFNCASMAWFMKYFVTKEYIKQHVGKM